MPISSRSNHGRHHSATGGSLLRQEANNESDKSDIHHNLRHSGSPNSGLNGNANAVNLQHRPNRKRPHSSRSGVIGQNGNSQNSNAQIVSVPGVGANESGLELVDLAVWAADVGPQISIPSDSSNALLAAAAAVTSSRRNLGAHYSPVGNIFTY